MDGIVSIREFKSQELQFLNVLKELSKRCQFLKGRQHSVFDPISNVSQELTDLSKAAITALSKQIDFFESLDTFSIISNSLDQLLQDSDFIKAYKSLLSNSISVILNYNVTFFRNGEFSIADLVSKIYQRLIIYECFSDIAHSSSGFTALRVTIKLFENNFLSKYKLINNNNLKFDKVYDLVSHSMKLQDPPKLSILDIQSHSTFKLTVSKFEEKPILIDLAQLSTGEMAIFKLNSGKVPTLFKSGKDILAELAAKNYDILNVGRTLMFTPLRPNQLSVYSYSGTNVELTTTTGNNIKIKLVCMEPIKWPSVWKPYLEKMFNNKNQKTQTQKINSAPLLKQNTKIPELNAPIEKKLHKKTSFESPLSSLVNLEKSNSQDSTNSGIMLKKESSNCDSIPSLEDIESLSYDKLILLDRSIEMNLSPIPQTSISPKIGQFRTESQIFSIDHLNADTLPKREHDDDVESIISDDNIHTDTFNPSVESYKPTLQKHKSNSLINLFIPKANSKPNLSLDTFESTTTSFFSNKTSACSSKINTPSSDTGDAASPLSKKDLYIPLPYEVQIAESIFQQNDLKITRWNGRAWEAISKDKVCVTLSRIPNKYITLSVLSESDNGKCFFVTKISSKCKCFRSTAQDIQIKVPATDILASALDLDESLETFTIRSRTIEKLMNSIHHAINGIVPVSLSASTTIRTLSTTMSSYFSDSSMRSSSYQSYLSSGKNEYSAKELSKSLLLASIKVRRHSKTDKKLWKSEDVGTVDIVSHECQNVRVAVNFDFMNNKTTLFTEQKKISVCNQLANIKRVGRTGISVVNNDGTDQLFEFTSKIVAEKVFNLIQTT